MDGRTISALFFRPLRAVLVLLSACRTGYAREARLSDRAVTQLAHFFVGALARPRALRAECRGVIRDSLCFGRRGHVTLAEAVELLPLPDRLKRYVMLRDEPIVGFSDDDTK